MMNRHQNTIDNFEHWDVFEIGGFYPWHIELEGKELANQNILKFHLMESLVVLI